MRCPVCGTENPSTSKFCTECGSHLPDPQDTVPQPVLNQQSCPVAPPAGASPSYARVPPVGNQSGGGSSKTKNKPPIAVILIPAVVLVIVIGLIIGIRLHKPSSTDGSDSTTTVPSRELTSAGEDHESLTTITEASETTAPSAEPTNAPTTEPDHPTGPSGTSERDFTNLYGYWRDGGGDQEIYITADGKFYFSERADIYRGYVDRLNGAYGMYLYDGTLLHGDASVAFPSGEEDNLLYLSRNERLSLYRTAYDGYPATQRTVWVAAPEEQLSRFHQHEEYVIDESEYASRMLVMTDYPVTDFKVLSLELKDVSQSGQLSFDTYDLFSAPILLPNRPFLLTVSMDGSIPTRGISYVDVDGVTRRFSVSLSGYDGSFVLTEF